MIVIESTGRKAKDAIEKGLAELGKTLREVDVQIIDNGGLFRKAKVRITVLGDDAPAVKPETPVKQVEKRTQEVKQEVKKEKPNEKREVREVREVHQVKEQKEKKERPVAVENRKERPRNEERKEQPVQQEERKERHYDPVTPEVAAAAEGFVTTLLNKMGISAEVVSKIENDELYIDLVAEGSVVIGYHGEVLDSIEYMTSYILNRDSDKHYRVVIDSNNYRAKRKESLIAHANKMAAKCIKVRHKIAFEPMNSSERKIVHSALADNDQIITRSEGHEPNRRVVILCKRR